MSGFDWPGMMRAGIHGLRLCPANFWDLTPIELMVMLGQDHRPVPMGRPRLHELLTAFPDTRERSDADGI